MDSSSPDFYLFLLNALHDSTAVVRSSRALRHEDPNDPSGGPFASHSDGLIKVLDALAAFCIRVESRQVTAVSSSLTLQGTKLWIAQNNAVPLEAELHIRNLWSILRRLAASLIPQTSRPDQDLPDPNITNDTQLIIEELRGVVYRYSIHKVRRRIQKQEDRWLSILPLMRTYNPDPKTAESLDFKLLAEDLAFLFHILGSNTPVEQTSQDLANLLLVAYRRIVRFLQMDPPSSSIDIFELRLPGNQNNFRFRHRPEKIFSLESHLDVITTFACSGRLRPYIDAPFDVERLHSRKQQQHFDISPSTITRKLTEYAALAPSRPQSNITKHCDAAIRRVHEAYGQFVHDTAVDVDFTNHAECVLLAYHVRERATLQPFNYFGCSKLARLACYLYFMAYNTVAHKLHFPVYRVRGTHRKMYPGWAAPGLADVSQELQENVSATMVESLKKEIAEHLESLHQRALSDSTSSSGVRSRLDLLDGVRVEQAVAESKQRYNFQSQSL